MPESRRPVVEMIASHLYHPGVEPLGGTEQLPLPLDAARGVPDRFPIREGVIVIRNILVGLDGSRTATGLAIGWAGQFGAEVTGVAVIDDLPDRKPLPPAVGVHSAKVRAYLDRVTRMTVETSRFRDEFQARCREAGVRYSARVETSDPVDILLALHEDYDLTLLPKEPRFRFATQDTPDDTLTEVLRQARRPIVAVPEVLPAGVAVVVAYDGGAAAVDALRSFAESGLGLGPPVSVVAVAEDQQTAEPRAEEASRFLAGHGVNAVPHPIVTESGHEADALRALAAQVNARMVVMGAYSHGRVREWFDCSTTTRMLRDEPRLLYLHHHPE
jgi:nucleotide-binding universal stress UspA family protein